LQVERAAAVVVLGEGELRAGVVGVDGGGGLPTDVTAKIGPEQDAAEVKIVEETDYPFGDTISLKITTAKPVHFPLYLRMPGWVQAVAACFPLTPALQALLREHVQRTGSPKAQRILDGWDALGGQFVKVYPSEYRRALEAAISEFYRRRPLVALPTGEWPQPPPLWASWFFR